MESSLDEVFAVLFGGAEPRHGALTRYGPWTSVVPGVVDRCEAFRTGDTAERYELTVFRGVTGLAADLWEHEVRAQMSISGQGHPALPTVVDGATDPGLGVSFSLTELPGGSIPEDEALAWLRDRPAEALRQFDLLLDALRRLHDTRMLHRNVTPAALRFLLRPGDDGEVRAVHGIVLTRFEMTTMIANLLRGGTVDARQDKDSILSLHVSSNPEQSARHLAYLSPERIDFVLGEAQSGNERDTSDLYGLGVLAFELFVGPLDQVDAFDAFRAAPSPRTHGALRDAMQIRVRRGRDLANELLPTGLCELIDGLLQRLPGSRLNAHGAAGHLEQRWTDILACWRPDEDRPYQVVFMPSQQMHLYNVGWVGMAPSTPEGRDELRQKIESDLRRADLVHRPDGAKGYRTGDPVSISEAEWILIGAEYVYFCVVLRRQDRSRDQRVLVIKYLTERHRAREVASSYPRRRIHALSVLSWEAGQALDGVVEGCPSWEPVLDEVRQRSVGDALDERFLASMDFLLRFQEVQLQAREYAVTVERVGPGRRRLRYDAERDRARRHGDHLLSAYAASEHRRPQLRRFIDGLDPTRGKDLKVELTPDRSGRPRWDQDSERWQVVRDVDGGDQDVIEVQSVSGGGGDVTVGWVRWSDDLGSAVSFGRQMRARPLLGSRMALVQKLRYPVSRTIPRRQLNEGDFEIQGESQAVVRNMLEQFPVHAVQGPPGAGKTTVVTEAVRLFLDQERTGRVLVSAQSNHALDNLGLRIIDLLRRTGAKDVPVIREIPPMASLDDDRVHELLWPHQLPRLVQTKIQEIKANVEEQVSGRNGTLDPAERRVLERWLGAVEDDDVEIADRLRRTAAVVLATCSVAGASSADPLDPSSSFDWVIIEEAAKAWPTELVMPLLRGPRWALIGDHRQIGAHGDQELRAFLKDLANDPDLELQAEAAAAEDHLAVFALFRSMFEPNKSGLSPEPSRHSTDRLTHQYRMHPDLAEPISRAYYPLEGAPPDALGPVGFLTSEPHAQPEHPFRRPHQLRGRHLVWIDTSDDPGCGDAPFWSNAGEAELIGRIIQAMEPTPSLPEARMEGSLVVLTPYRAQIHRLHNAGVDRSCIHTIHSFQGRESDCVIVSLVRSGAKGDGVLRNLGHLDMPELVNVLFSRGRRLNIIVGSLDHISTYGSSHWQTVLAVVRELATIIPSSELDLP